MTAEDEAESQSSPVQSSEDDDDTPEETTVKSVTSTSSVSSRTVEIKREVSATEPSKVFPHCPHLGWGVKIIPALELENDW